MIGLWMVEFMNYDLFMMIGLVGTFWSLITSWKTAIWLDSLDPEKFKLFGKVEKAGAYEQVMSYEKSEYNDEGVEIFGIDNKNAKKNNSSDSSEDDDTAI